MTRQKQPGSGFVTSWGNSGTGRCEKIDFKICSELGVKKIALGCPLSDRWGVGKHLGSKIKSRKLQQTNFFTSSRRDVCRSAVTTSTPLRRNGCMIFLDVLGVRNA